MKTFRNYFFYLLLMLFCQTAVAEIAAKVIFAKGETYVVHHTGKKVALKKGAALKAGDKIITQIGYLQLRFTDDGIISFYDNTEFKIEDYHYSQNKDDNEKAFFHFAKGVFRTIVGSIKQERYKVRTNIASIGTRGTEYLAKLNDGLHVDVFDGTVVLENQAGNFEIASGHSAFMPDVFSIPKFIRLENKINRPLDNKQQPVNQPAIKQENNAPAPENNGSLPSNNSPALNHPEAINKAPSLPNNLSHENLEVMNNHPLHHNGTITNNAPPPRHRELDSYQEKAPAPVTNSITSTNITIENVLNKKIAPEELPPPEPVSERRPPVNNPAPINNPTPAPINNPTPTPINNPTPAPINNPTPTPINNPTPTPINNPTPTSINNPTPTPINNPTPASTDNPAPAPITEPTPTTEPATAPPPT